MKRSTLVVIAHRGRILRWSRRTGAVTVWSTPRRRWVRAGPLARWIRGSVTLQWAPP